MTQKEILVFQALVGGKKKSILPVRYSSKMEGASCLKHLQVIKCIRRRCREVNITLDMLPGCLARKYLYAQTKKQHYFWINQLQKIGAYLIFSSTTSFTVKLQELRRPMWRNGQNWLQPHKLLLLRAGAYSYKSHYNLHLSFSNSLIFHNSISA